MKAVKKTAAAVIAVLLAASLYAQTESGQRTESSAEEEESDREGLCSSSDEGNLVSGSSIDTTRIPAMSNSLLLNTGGSLFIGFCRTPPTPISSFPDLSSYPTTTV